jgi:tetratricopeptide (TPR) repeat protein
LRARSLAARGATRGEVEDAWRGVLALRPERVEPLVQLGVLAATSDRSEDARRDLERALALDPGHPGVLRNLATLAFEEGRTDEGFALLARVDARHAPDASSLVDLASSLYLRGREAAADALFARIDPELAPSSAEKAHAIAQREKEAGRARVADAASARAQRIWARGHAAAGRWDDAVRIYRQELRISRDHAPGGAPNVRLESAAASLRAGDEEAARAMIEGLEPTAEDRARLPAWAIEALRARGWLDGTSGS